MDLSKMTIESIHSGLKNRDFTSVEITKAYLDKIKEKNDDINAFLSVSEDALKQAEESDKRYQSSNDLGDLDGVPVAIKDTILVKGEKVTAGSKMLANYTATYDATAVERLRKAGAVLVGKTNCDEFAMGVSNETSYFGGVKNPVAKDRVAGGSGGGSAAAVAGNMSVAALGSDTGGSVRLPGAFCGIVGFRPTYDTISRHGLISLASSFDQIGTNTKTVKDSEILFKNIVGKDEMDSTNEDHSLKKEPEGPLNIGVPVDMPMDSLSKDVLKNFEDAKQKFIEMGYTIKDIKLPHLKYGVSCYYIILPAEASANLARYDGVRYGLHEEGDDLLSDYMKSRGSGFGKEVRRRIILGTYVLSAGYYDSYYGKALMVREMVKKEIEEAFEEVDAIITPTTVGPAFKPGDKIKDPVAMYLEDLYTVPSVLAGTPAISVPSGTINVEGQDLPLGLQVMAPRFREDICFKVGKDFESAVK